MRAQTLGVLLAGLLSAAAPARADVRLTLENGLVTLSAHDATLRQILTEWARVGQTRIVNSDRLAGPPMSVELSGVPEAQALDTLLRSVSGYLAAPRAVPLADASLYDRIYLLPTSAGTAARAVAAAPPQAFSPPPVFAPPDDDQVDDDDPRARRPPPPNSLQPGGTPAGGPAQGPRFTTFPQAPFQNQPPGGAAEPTAEPQNYPAPTAPVGVARPGMPVPVPAAPGQPNASPGEPRR